MSDYKVGQHVAVKRSGGIGGSVMFALGLITVATVLKPKFEFRRHYRRHHMK